MSKFMAWSATGWLNGWKLERFTRKGCWQTRRQVEMDGRACYLAGFNPEAGIVRRYESTVMEGEDFMMHHGFTDSK